MTVQCPDDRAGENYQLVRLELAEAQLRTHFDQNIPLPAF